MNNELPVRLIKSIPKFHFNILDCLLLAMAFGPITLQIDDKTPKLFWSDIFIFFYFVLIPIRIFSKKDRNVFYFHVHVKWFLLFGFLILTSFIVSENVIASVDTAKLLIMPFIVFMIAFNEIKSKNDVEHLCALLVLLALYFAISSLYNWRDIYIGTALLERGSGFKDMIQTVTGRSNTVAGINALLIPMAFAITFKKNMIAKLIGVSAIIILVTSVLFAMSRASILALIIGLIVWILLELITSRKRNRIYVNILLVLAISFLSVFVAWYILPSDFKALINLIYEQTVYVLSFARETDPRWSSWVFLLSIVPQYPLGIGVGNYQETLLNLYPDLIGTAHNFYLDVVVQLGILGFVVLMIILYNYAKILTRQLKLAAVDFEINISKCLMMSYAIFLVNVFFEPNYYSPTFMYIFSVMMAMAYALYRFNSQNIPPSTKVLII